MFVLYARSFAVFVRSLCFFVRYVRPLAISVRLARLFAMSFCHKQLSEEEAEVTAILFTSFDLDIIFLSNYHLVIIT